MRRISAHRLICILSLLAVTMLASACSSQPPTLAATPTTVAPVPVGTEAVDGTTAEATGASVPSQIQAVEDVAQIVASRTPVPTGTPDRIERQIEEIIDQTGWADRKFLGLSPNDWINVLASIVVFIIGYIVVAVLLFRILAWVVKRTGTTFDDEFLHTTGRELKWLVVIVTGRIAILRLDVWNDPQLILLDDIFFFLAIGTMAVIGLRLIKFAGDWVLKNRIAPADQVRLAPFVLMSKRLGYFLVLVIAGSIAVAHLGINVTWIVVLLFFLAVVVALGIREAIDDMASGFLILLDPPFRVGDDIYIKEIDAWGKVVEIGLRNTHLRTLDHRYVIVPNAQIGKNQIINFTYPESIMRIDTHISLAYGTNVAEARQVIEATVRGIEGVLPDRPIKVYFMEFGDSALQFRVLWWIDNVNDRYMMLDRVNTALATALDAAGIVIPYPVYDLNVNVRAKNHSRVGRPFTDSGGDESSLEESGS